MVAGAHALAHHALPRFTEDIDFFVRRSSENARRIRETVEEFGFKLEADAEERLAKSERGMIMFGRKPNRVDVLNFLDGVEFDEAWPRRSVGLLAGVEVSFLGLRDYVATKRASGRIKDRLDLDFVEKIVGSLPD